mgnify:FL=1
MVSSVFDKAMTMACRPEYVDRDWLAVELARLLAAGEWAELGAVAVHAALAAAPVSGDLFTRLGVYAFAELEGAAWDDRTWVAGELGTRISALVAPGSDLHETGLRLAGAAARVEVGS